MLHKKHPVFNTPSFIYHIDVENYANSNKVAISYQPIKSEDDEKLSKREDLFTQPRAFFVLSERQRFFQSPLETIIKSERNEAHHGKRARRDHLSPRSASLSPGTQLIHSITAVQILKAKQKGLPTPAFN